MAKAGLIIFGLIILGITFFALEIAFSPEDKSDIETLDSMCKSEVEVFGINLKVGSWGQKLLGNDAKEACQKANYFMLLFVYGWIGYVFGGLLFLAGLFSGGVQHHRRVEHHQERPHNKNTKHCGECGAKLEGSKNFCHGCGSKI